MKNSVDSTAAYLSQFEKIGTETAELFRNKKWEETPLGPISGWSETLKSAASICLQCKSPVLVMWGSDFTQIYNDAFSLIMDANRHPNLYGTNAAKCWYDIWPHSGPILETVLVTGKAFENEDLCMFLVNKQGKEEERYFTFTYNPLFDNTKSTIEGIFAIIIETTDKIISQRRLNLLRELSSHSTEATNAKDACYMLLRAIGTGSVDIPFASIYSVEYSQSTTRLKLVDTVGGIEKGTPYTPLSLSTDIDITKYSNKEKDFLLALLRVVKTGTPETFDLSDYDLPKCPWGRVPTSCVISAICSSQGKPVGLLIAGLSPVLNFNENYQSFFNLLAGQAGTILANARAHEEERKRLEMMAEIDRAKTNFFSNISHEFRTPLTLMLGPLEELLNNENAVNMDFKEHVSLVHRNALRLLKLVNNLLEVSRIEAGRVQVNYEPTNLQELTKDLASVFHSAMEKAGLEYIVNCETITEPVYVDREMWEKIVMNLLSNAFKFTLTGSIFVTQKQISSNNVQLTIEDTGVGIPEEDIPKLFERFYRVHESKGRSWEGTGIGLAMVSELVKLQEGTIQVKSKLEKGTTITVIIPIRGNKAQGITGENEKKIQLTNSPKYTRTTGWWVPEMTTNISNLNLNEKTRQQILENMNFTEENERPNILIVDDNADMREYLTKLLKFNYNVLTACDGIEALEVVQKKVPSLILTDIMMPRLDGVGLLHKIRENPKTQVVPVILLSARAGEEAQVEGLQQGADDYLIKPFSSNELLARVKTHLNLYKVRMEARQAEIATRAKDHFLAVLSHELRTPLTPVLLLVSELEQNKELSKQIKEDIQLIARNIKLEVRLIDDLLDITRIINNKLSLNLCPTNAQEEIEHTIELVKSEAKTKSIQLIIHFNAKKNIILADPSRLQQVFWNLIKNSIKFSSIGGNVTIITDNFTPNTFDLKVIDQGIGIEKDQLEKIFDTFQQANPNIEHQFGGLGLGLSISKALVQLMKGTIIAYSEGPGTGATFTVTLPLVNQKVPMKFPIKTDISKSRVLPKKILLIEDNKSTALVMNRFLQRLGHNVKLATCVKEALTIAKQDSFELVISDIGLPDGNGFDLMKQLNQLYNNKLKAICVTGYGMKDDLKKSQESGFAVHLVKPIEFSSLEEAISEVYKGEIK